MLTEKDYCDYETCVALMEVRCRVQTEWYIHQPSYERGSCCLCYGISEDVLDESDYIPRYSLYEAQKWLREEKDIHVLPELGLIHRNKNGITHYYRVLVKNMNNGIIITLDNDRDDFESYEEALCEGIKEAVTILKEKRK